MKPLIAFIALLTAVNPLHAQDKAALREISGAFDKIEADYKTWPHHTYGGENLEGGQAYEHSVWKSDGDKDFIKVESLDFNEHGESKTQFFFKDSRLLFTLDRRETVRMVPNAPTEVLERRYYFADSQLIRVLEKEGAFPNGGPTDTAGLKNRELPLNAIENAAETYSTQHEIAAGIIERARMLEQNAGPSDAPANHQSGEGWREIAGSGSRDGIYALAWGLKDHGEIEGETQDDGTLSVDPENENLVNYLVNLRTKTIVGSIKGKHFGDKSTYNHFTTETAWSAASMFVAQTNSGKWATFDSNVYELRDTGEASVSKAADLLAATKKAIFKDPKAGELFKKFDQDSFTTTLRDVHIAQRGATMIVSVEASLMIPKGEEEGSNFDATVVFAINSDENGGAPLLQWISTAAQ